MQKLSLKERMIYRFIFNEKRVYVHWYSRFLICGAAFDRIRRVVSRIPTFHAWCDEWSREGETLYEIAEGALNDGNALTAKDLFHEAAACFHIAQHIFFLDLKKKQRAQERVRESYRKAIELYAPDRRPIRIEVPWEGVVIPGYLRLASTPNRPLVIQINGLDNLKEVENHWMGDQLLKADFNVLAFDGPGQGEMWESRKLTPDYEKAVCAVLDWLWENNQWQIDLRRIATSGLSFGGYLSPRVAAFDDRICCAVGNGGPAFLPSMSQLSRVNPIWIRDLLHVLGFEDLSQAEAAWDQFDIRTAPPLEKPLLFFQGGKDRLIPHPRAHADCFMDWAIGKKELRFYPEGEHCCINYMDEVIPYTIDWLEKTLSA